MLRLTPPQKPHIIVLGNVKGGSGKSTLSMHMAIGLLGAGRRVATLDLDFDQQTLTRYLNNRQAFGADKELLLATPTHFRFEEAAYGTKEHSAEDSRLNYVSNAIAKAEADNDFIIIDTPSGVNKTNLFAHALADTIITPINDSFLDLDVIVPPKGGAKQTFPTPYAEIIRQAREARRLVTPRTTDWIVLRNRISSLETRNERAIRDAIEEAGAEASFRCARGLTERVIYRELFPKGLTAFDSMEASLLGVQPSLSHVLAREEVRQLISMVQVKPSEQSDRWTRYPQAPAA
jgi:chromosome partitioning protein